MIKIPCMEELEKIYNTGWSDWKSFPDPRKGEYLIAPFGSGVYQFRNTKVDKYSEEVIMWHIECLRYYLSLWEKEHVRMKINGNMF